MVSPADLTSGSNPGRERRAFRRLPFNAQVEIRRGLGQPEQVVDAEFLELTPSGARVLVPDATLVRGETVALGISASRYRLLDIAAEVIHVEPDRCQGCRAGLEFRPSLPRRQYLLLRRLTRP